MSYHSNSLNGNHADLYLKRYKAVLDGCIKSQEVKGDLFSLLNSLQYIFKTLAPKTFLDEATLDTLDGHIRNVGILYPILLKKCTPELHELTIHLLTFLRMYYNISLFSEEDSEKLHKLGNETFSCILNVKPRQNIIRLGFQSMNHALQVLPNKERIFRPTNRKINNVRRSF